MQGSQGKTVTNILTVAGLFGLAFGAFSSSVRKEIFHRDNGTCQCCGKNFYVDGIMMHASHFDHHPDDHSYYNNPENGQLECIKCHLFNDHLPQMQELGDEHYRASVKLATLAYQKGYHTDRWYQIHPESLAEDRDDLVQSLQRLGYNPDYFIDSEQITDQSIE